MVLAKDNSRVRNSTLTSSGVVAIPLAFLAGGLLVVFGLTLLSGRGRAADVEKIGAEFVNVMDGRVAKAVMVVVYGIVICLVLIRFSVVIQLVATWQLVTGRLGELDTVVTAGMEKLASVGDGDRVMVGKVPLASCISS